MINNVALLKGALFLYTNMQQLTIIGTTTEKYLIENKDFTNTGNNFIKYSIENVRWPMSNDSVFSMLKTFWQKPKYKSVMTIKGDICQIIFFILTIFENVL